jgi:hypothetical protein
MLLVIIAQEYLSSHCRQNESFVQPLPPDEGYYRHRAME